ncbi:MAG: SpoIID/LytB domain-containing protein, partial [Armatimonadota bacterium]|nr:SpoIID/LytB domain-containing protein [Armatimonadota bacterium]
PLEALKAQAIVARTFARACVGRHGYAGYDVCAGVHCQVYPGVAAERSTSDQAVCETAGRVLMAAGKVFPAYFHASCGGATDAAAAVWGGPAQPGCAAGVWDSPTSPCLNLTAEGGVLGLLAGTVEFFCAAAPDYRWSIQRTRGELERTFARALPLLLGRRAPLGELRDLITGGRTSGGRLTLLVVEGSEGVYPVRGEEIRWLFGSGRAGEGGLPGRRFVVVPERDPLAPDGPPVAYRFVGTGNGHGVGLCQWGAMGMARRGERAEEILRHYFPGATLEVGE